MKIFRILVGFALLLGIVYLSVFGPFFRTWKLQLAGHQVIESHSHLLGFLTGREFFWRAVLSPDQKTLAVRSIIGTNQYQGGQLVTSLFNIQTGQRLWRTINKKIDSLDWTTSFFIWSSTAEQILGFGFPNAADVFDAKTGKIIKELHKEGICTAIKAANGEITPLNNCLKVSQVALVSENFLSLLWTKPFNEAEQVVKNVNSKKKNVQGFLSPNKMLYLIEASQSMQIYDAKNNQPKLSPFSTLWSTGNVVWSPDSTMIAIGGDNYAFKGVDGEDVQANKNAVIIKINQTGIEKRRLFTYGERVQVVGFVENGRKLVGLTDSTIIIWDLQK